MEMKRMTTFDMKPFNAKPLYRKHANGLSVTVSENTVILASDTYQALNEPEYVEVGFNEEMRIFGIRKSEEGSKYAIKLAGYGNTYQIPRTIIVRKIEDILPFNRKKYNLILENGELDSESGYYLFDIDKGLIVPRKARKQNGN